MKKILTILLITLSYNQILSASCCSENYKECRVGNGKGCYNLGLISEYNKKREPNYKKAAKLYQIAIDHGYADGYIRLGILHLKGLGVKKDIDKAKELFATACDYGRQNGCYNYELLQQQGSNKCSYLR